MIDGVRRRLVIGFARRSGLFALPRHGRIRRRRADHRPRRIDGRYHDEHTSERRDVGPRCRDGCRSRRRRARRHVDARRRLAVRRRQRQRLARQVGPQSQRHHLRRRVGPRSSQCGESSARGSTAGRTTTSPSPEIRTSPAPRRRRSRCSRGRASTRRRATTCSSQSGTNQDSSFGIELITDTTLTYWDGKEHIAQATIPSVVGQWHHYGVVVDGSQARIYFDGVRVSQAVADTTPRTATQVYFGHSSFGDYLRGAVDKARFFRVALTDAEMMTEKNR